MNFPMCKIKDDLVENAFFHSDFVRAVWFSLPFGPELSGEEVMSLHRWIGDAYDPLFWGKLLV